MDHRDKGSEDSPRKNEISLRRSATFQDRVTSSLLASKLFSRRRFLSNPQLQQFIPSPAEIYSKILQQKIDGTAISFDILPNYYLVEGEVVGGEPHGSRQALAFLLSDKSYPLAGEDEPEREQVFDLIKNAPKYIAETATSVGKLWLVANRKKKLDKIAITYRDSLLQASPNEEDQYAVHVLWRSRRLVTEIMKGEGTPEGEKRNISRSLKPLTCSDNNEGTTL